MNISEQTLQQIDRAIRKIAEKFPAEEEASQMTDIHLRVAQDTGELTVFNDDDEEITRCIVEQWIDNADNFPVTFAFPVCQRHHILATITAHAN